jgi:hypothetical protein
MGSGGIQMNEEQPKIETLANRRIIGSRLVKELRNRNYTLDAHYKLVGKDWLHILVGDEEHNDGFSDVTLRFIISYMREHNFIPFWYGIADSRHIEIRFLKDIVKLKLLRGAER